MLLTTVVLFLRERSDMKGVSIVFGILMSGIVGYMFLLEKASPGRNIYVTRLENDDRVVLEDLEANGFRVYWAISLGRTYCFDLLCRKETKEYGIDTDAPNENLGDYELPAYYNGGLSGNGTLCIIEEASLLIDLKRKMSFPVRRKGALKPESE